MLHHELLRDEGVLIVTPDGPLEAADFKRLADEVDPYIKEKGNLHGLMISAESFPGWKDFGSLVSHLKFVKNHHHKIDKVAAVTDSGFMAIVPRVARHFIHAEVRHFPHEKRDAALVWLQMGER
jgi:hypothetical protein